MKIIKADSVILETEQGGLSHTQPVPLNKNLLYCDECGKEEFKVVIQMGEPDIEGYICQYCIECVTRAKDVLHAHVLVNEL